MNARTLGSAVALVTAGSLAILLAGCGSPPDEGTRMMAFAAPAEAESTTPDPHRAGPESADLDMEAIRGTITHLSERIGPRVAGSRELKEAAEYVRSALAEVGYDAQSSAFEDAGVPTAWIEWARDDQLHQPTDLSDSLDWEKVGAVAEATLELALSRSWVAKASPGRAAPAAM